MNLIEIPPEPKDQLVGLIEQTTGCLSSPNMTLVSVAAENLHTILGKTTLVNELNVLEHFQGAVAPINNLIASSAWEDAESEVYLLRQGINVFFQFTLYGEPGVDMLMQANVLPTLMTPLAHDDNEVQNRTIILIFGMLHKGRKSEVINALMESNFLNLVRDLMGPSTSKMTKEYTWNVLAGILDDGTRAQYEMVADVNFLPSFLHATTHHFGQHNLEMKLEAAIVLIKLWDNGIRHGHNANELTIRFEPYQVNRELVNQAKAFQMEAQQTIIIMKFARALGLNNVSED